LLHKAGSVYVTRPGLPDYIVTREELLERAAALFEVVRSGKVKIEVMQRHALKDAAQAHRDLEARKTTGSTVLLP
jgi:NADPH2:quinone reductase